ncbi:glycerate kinase [Halobacillus litoralis]|nr:glycerate kinase [Halobacillus litoralis]
MNVLVAPDSFKGSMSSAEACDAICEGISKFNPAIQTQSMPIADGGEGTVEALVKILHGDWIEEQVEDPLGRKVTAAYGWVPETKTAIIETAQASGLPRLKREELDPLRASTFGTGELIKSALDLGAKRIILGLGGSATVDAGAGCFQALGVNFYDAEGKELKMTGGNLSKVSQIESDYSYSMTSDVEWLIASDVSNPLLGQEGAVEVFGPQKGVTKSRVERFEEGMSHYASVLEGHTGRLVRDKEGSGAAGGFGFTLFSLLDNLKVESGFELIARLGELEKHIQKADLVITGEGKLDRQSLYGKGPVGLARLAKKHRVPCIAFTGMYDGEISGAKEEGLLAILPIVDRPMELDEAVGKGPELIRRATERFLDVYFLNRTIGVEIHE